MTPKKFMFEFSIIEILLVIFPIMAVVFVLVQPYFLAIALPGNIFLAILKNGKQKKSASCVLPEKLWIELLRESQSNHLFFLAKSYFLIFADCSFNIFVLFSWYGSRCHLFHDEKSKTVRKITSRMLTNFLF